LDENEIKQNYDEVLIGRYEVRDSGKEVIKTSKKNFHIRFKD
jgi:hypothetical protein